MKTIRQSTFEMNNKTFTKRGSPSSLAKPPCSAVAPELTRLLHTTIVSTQIASKKNFSTELLDLTQRPAFRAILDSIKALSQSQTLTEQQSAEEIIDTFRRLDQLWNEYLFCEGLNKLKTEKK